MSGVFIQILMTRYFDLVTGNSLKGWLQQQDSLLCSQVVEATTQTQASRPKTAPLIKGRKSRVAGERRVKNMCSKKSAKTQLLNEIYRTINARDVLFTVNLVMSMSISEVLVIKTRWSSATTAKIWNLLNFCQFLLAKNWK